jgi:hypothetical protein
MDCIVLSQGYKINCGIAGGAKVVWIGSHITDNKYVKDTGDTAGTYSAVADAGSGLIEITADNGSGGHGLQEGLVINLNGGAYDGNYTVVSTPTATTFRVKATFGATDAGNYQLEPQGNKIIGTDSTLGTDPTFFKFEQEIETIEVLANGQGSIESGTFYEEQNITMTLFSSKDQASEDARRTLINQLTKGRFIAIVEDNNGVKRFYGSVNGLKLSEGSNNSGKALADLSGFTFTLQAKEPEIAFIYDESGSDSGQTGFTAFTLP